MSTSGKIVLSVGVASSALLAAWLLTGDRKVRTRKFVARKAANLKAMKSGAWLSDDQMAYYI